MDYRNMAERAFEGIRREPNPDVKRTLLSKLLEGVKDLGLGKEIENSIVRESKIIQKRGFGTSRLSG